MQSFETSRLDIRTYRDERSLGKQVRLVTIGSYGDETVKGLTDSEAMALAAALIEAAGHGRDGVVRSVLMTQAETAAPVTGSCPKCGHWPYRGQHADIGCFATAGTLKPCGCKHVGQPVPC